MLEQQPFLNELLAHLPHREWALLAPHATIVTLRNAELIFEGHDPGTLTYFPLTSIIP